MKDLIFVGLFLLFPGLPLAAIFFEHARQERKIMLSKNTCRFEFDTETEALAFIRGVEYGQQAPEARPGKIRKVEGAVHFVLALDDCQKGVVKLPG